MKEMEGKPQKEEDKWKKELESKALWREWVEGAVGRERGCLPGK